MRSIVLKIGGSELETIAYAGSDTAVDDFVAGLIDAVCKLQQDYAVALVHGGGKTIANWQAQIGLEPRFVDGLRVTDDVSLDIAEMVLSGLLNKRLVARFISAGIPAAGLSGVDGGLFRVNRLQHRSGDLGWVGNIVETHPTLAASLLDIGVLPVISPISLGVDGHTYNVNADHAATALACAIGATELVFVSNVLGVLIGRDGDPACEEKECAGMLTASEVHTLIHSGQISGGMVPKVHSALTALDSGVPRVRITNLEGVCIGGGTCLQ
ncbi:MAG: acetylglutamate kinase [Anaerolineae bacterium]|nr:acetylglutamate kinase [Anaerolineae bacterium]